MNTGSAFAAIVSPLVAGFVIDATGNWYLPFLMSLGLLLLGGFSAFLIHPERRLRRPRGGCRPARWWRRSRGGRGPPVMHGSRPKERGQASQMVLFGGHQNQG
jgi:MFS family permease